MCKLTYSRTLLVSAVIGAAVCVGDGPPLEPYLVLTRQAELFDGSNRVPVRLVPGDVLPARVDETHWGWLRVTLNRKILQAKAEHFGRLRDLEVAYSRRIADLDSRIAENTRRIAQQDETSERLYAAEHAVGFDATVQYRYRQAVPLDPPSAAPGGPPPPALPIQAVRYVDTYDDKIPPARARNLAGRWARQRHEAEADSQRLRQERRDAMCDRLGTEAQRVHVAWRFAAFDAEAGVLSDEPYVTVKDRTQLYAGTRLAQELPADVVVMAALNRTDEQWLTVRWYGQILDGPKNCFLSRLDVENQLGRRAAWLGQALRDQQEEADSLAGRRQLLETIGLAADYASQVDYAALYAYPFAPGYRGGCYYLPPVGRSDAVEVVNRSRANSFVKACDKETDTIDARLRQADKTLRAWRRELATCGPRLENLRRRLDAAR